MCLKFQRFQGQGPKVPCSYQFLHPICNSVQSSPNILLVLSLFEYRQGFGINMSRLGFPNLHQDHGMRVDVVVSLRTTSSNFASHRCNCNMDISLMRTRGEERQDSLRGGQGGIRRCFVPKDRNIEIQVACESSKGEKHRNLNKNERAGNSYEVNTDGFERRVLRVQRQSVQAKREGQLVLTLNLWKQMTKS